jgi:hypothetical protein
MAHLKISIYEYYTRMQKQWSENSGTKLSQTTENKAAYLRVKDITIVTSFHAQSSGLSFALPKMGK